MSVTDAGRQLTESYRLAQTRIGRETVRRMFEVWQLLDPTAVDDTVEQWLQVAMALTKAQRQTSAQLAADYVRAFRAVELGTLAGFDASIPTLAPDEALATSLTVTGPAALKSGMTRGYTVDRAASLARNASSRAAHRLALNGGRTTVMAAVASDDRALGFSRATSGSACAFCAILASRGAVYTSERTADFEAHDGCSCSPEPLYARDAPLPPGASQYAAQWEQAKSLGSDEGIPATVAFRRIIENRA